MFTFEELELYHQRLGFKGDTLLEILWLVVLSTGSH